VAAVDSHLDASNCTTASAQQVVDNPNEKNEMKNVTEKKHFFPFVWAHASKKREERLKKATAGCGYGKDSILKS